MHNYSRGCSTRKGDGAQTEAQTGESGTKRGRRSPRTLTGTAAVTAPTDGWCLELLEKAVVVVWARKCTKCTIASQSTHRVAGGGTRCPPATHYNL